jgi:hypothetical protein
MRALPCIAQGQWRWRRCCWIMGLGLTPGTRITIRLAAALGDIALAERLVTEDQGCLSHRIGKLPEFPPVGHHGRGGTIYQWTLRFNSYPHQIALTKGHRPMFDFLYAASDTATRLLVNCVLARRAEAEAIAKEYPEIVPALPGVDLELVAKYCWETNTNYDAVQLMLDLGFPVAHPERSHGYTPLHNAAWAGSGDLVDLLIARGHAVDIRDPGYNATPLGMLCTTVWWRSVTRRASLREWSRRSSRREVRWKARNIRPATRRWTRYCTPISKL